MTAEPAQPIVPPYLIELCRQLDPNSLARALESNRSERGLIDLAIDTQAKLADWEKDDDFWSSLSPFLENESNNVLPDDSRLSPESLGELLDDEVEVAILSNALAGDERLATAVLLESPTSVRPRPSTEVTVIQNAVGPNQSKCDDCTEHTSYSATTMAIGQDAPASVQRSRRRHPHRSRRGRPRSNVLGQSRLRRWRCRYGARCRRLDRVARVRSENHPVGWIRPPQANALIAHSDHRVE